MEDVKEVEETTVEEASASEESEELEESGADESDTEESVETESEEDSVDEIDHKAELEKERVRLGKKIDKERDKRVEAEKNKGLSSEDVSKIVKEEVAQSEKRLQKDRVNELADRLSGSDAERELIILHYENSIVPTGNLEEDIENAYAIANKKANQTKISELKKAARSKQSRVSSSSAGAPAGITKTKKYTQDDIDGAEFAGVSVEEFVKEKNK